MLLTKEPNLEWKIVSLWWLSFCQDNAKHFHLADASCEIDKTLGRKAYSIYVYVFPNDKFNRTFHPVLLIESQPKSTPLWQCAYHPCKDKATQTHTYTHTCTSRASLAWHAGPAHYYNAKLLVAKETLGRGRVPVAMAASLHPANCLPPWDVTIVDRERKETGRKSEGRTKWGEKGWRGLWLRCWKRRTCKNACEAVGSLENHRDSRNNARGELMGWEQEKRETLK